MRKGKFFSLEVTGIETYEGERLEDKIKRAIEKGENMDATADIFYTEEKDGVRAETDIRTDKWEIAQHGVETYWKKVEASETLQTGAPAPSAENIESNGEPKQDA